MRNPLGGSFTLEYERTANSQAMPHSRQVLKRVTVDDGVDLGPSFASPNLVTSISYGDGFYHRNEKEFFGFASVTTTRADGVSSTDQFDNTPTHYALHGRLLRQTVRDENGGLLSRRELQYDVRSVLDATEQPVAIDPVCLANRHPLLAEESSACIPQHVLVVREDTTHAEGGTLAKTRTTRDLAHDRLGTFSRRSMGMLPMSTDDVHAHGRTKRRIHLGTRTPRQA